MNNDAPSTSSGARFYLKSTCPYWASQSKSLYGENSASWNQELTVSNTAGILEAMMTVCEDQ